MAPDENISPNPPTPPASPASPSTSVPSFLAGYEKKIEELSKRLQEEREKLLVAQLKSQEERATSAKVEVSLKDLQERLRRDRREQEQEEVRLKLEKRLQELEIRLAQERETWVATLKNQIGVRESQEKGGEGHFATRLEEIERRWLEEKTNWQKASLAKDEEIRTLRSSAEKSRGVEADLSKTAFDREKELIQLRAELALARQSSSMIQERLERDLASLRAREERLFADLERLQQDSANAKRRSDAEKEADVQRLRSEYEAGLVRRKQIAQRAIVESKRLRAVAGAIERQYEMARSRLEEFKRAAVEWEKARETHKTELTALQRKWLEREKEIRAEAATQFSQAIEAERTRLQTLESEKARLQAQAQQELDALRSRWSEREDEIRAEAAAQSFQLRQENESERRLLESKLRADLETELQARRQELAAQLESQKAQAESEANRLRQEFLQKESAWGERLLAQESEALVARGRADEAVQTVQTQLSRALEEQKEAFERLSAERESAEARARQAEGRAQELGAQLDAWRKTSWLKRLFQSK